MERWYGRYEEKIRSESYTPRAFVVAYTEWSLILFLLELEIRRRDIDLRRQTLRLKLREIWM